MLLPAATDVEEDLAQHRVLGKTYDEFSMSAMVLGISRRPEVGRKDGQWSAQKD